MKKQKFLLLTLAIFSFLAAAVLTKKDNGSFSFLDSEKVNADTATEGGSAGSEGGCGGSGGSSGGSSGGCTGG